mmetsp:Transcript_5549/g.23536  ORF Transcript_5549/g.23536 Transcript_5549/m.23536 type:complete len:251 (+) Transcript_5549:2206-2958(+)
MRRAEPPRGPRPWPPDSSPLIDAPRLRAQPPTRSLRRWALPEPPRAHQQLCRQCCLPPLPRPRPSPQRQPPTTVARAQPLPARASAGWQPADGLRSLRLRCQGCRLQGRQLPVGERAETLPTWPRDARCLCSGNGPQARLATCRGGRRAATAPARPQSSAAPLCVRGRRGAGNLAGQAAPARTWQPRAPRCIRQERASCPNAGAVGPCRRWTCTSGTTLCQFQENRAPPRAGSARKSASARAQHAEAGDD